MNTVETASAVMFWVCAALVCYAYLVYPLLIWGLARWFGRQGEIPASDGELPTVSLLIAAHNEEAVISHILEALLRVDYPPERLQIMPVNDRSADGTRAIIDDYVVTGERIAEIMCRLRASATYAPDLAGVTDESRKPPRGS